MMLFRLTIFWSALLLFLVQPMMGRLLLPKVGGSPAVWITCQMFFQLALLVGYGYAHWLSRVLTVVNRARLHWALAAVSLLAPLGIASEFSGEGSPVFWIVWSLLVGVAAPFVVLAASSPLLQHWFALSHERTPHSNPYSLFVASNAGSLLALVAYPLLVEPNFGLAMQTKLWRGGFLLFCVLLAVAIEVVRSRTSLGDDALVRGATGDNECAIDPKQRLRWLALAFVPSSWMLGTTTFITTDLAPTPLLWAVPLVLYLTSFIVAFAEQPWLSPATLRRGLPFALLLLLASLLFRGHWQSVATHSMVFFLGAWTMHSELAASRPHPSRLTEFYFWLSLGGCLGGIFNGLVAPLMFPVPWEYPLAIVAALLLLPRPARVAKGESQKAELVMLGVVAGIIALLRFVSMIDDSAWSIYGLLGGMIAAVICIFQRRPRWLAVALALALGIDTWQPPQDGETLLVQRSFFGVHRVLRDAKSGQHQLFHGVTIHGMQDRGEGVDEADTRRTPLAYYHRSGPLGDVFASVGLRLQPKNDLRKQREVAIVGLGTGAIAAYHRPGDRFTFYEIDPTVRRIATDTSLFTYLADRNENECRIEIGDGRQKLDAAEDGRFDLIILDAFSSDAIPFHLLTREAIATYRRKLRPGGWQVFHISNKHLNFEKVLSNIAAAEHLAGAVKHDNVLDDTAIAAGHSHSSFVVLTREEKSLQELFRRGWLSLQDSTAAPPWTDDFSNLVGALRILDR